MSAFRYEFDQGTGKGKRTQWYSTESFNTINASITFRSNTIAHSLDPAQEYIAGPGNHLKPWKALTVKDNYPEIPPVKYFVVSITIFFFFNNVIIIFFYYVNIFSRFYN